MKSRKKNQLLPNKPVIKRSESSIPTSSARKLQSPSSTTSLLHNFEFWQRHTQTFGSQNLTQQHSGDADSFFKKSLRSYEKFDTRPIEKFLKSSAFPHKRASSVTFSPRPRSVFTPTLTPRPTTSSSSKKRVTLVTPRDESEDVDVFYSPGSDSARSHEAVTSTNQINVYLETTEMAEEAEDYGEEVVAAEDEAPVSVVPEDVPETETEDEDDEMKEVQQIIKQASDDLKQVVEENQQLLGDMGEEEGEEEVLVQTVAPIAGGDGSVFQFDPAVDSAVLKELEEAERQAKETAKIITELKMRVTELLKKEKCTEAEAKELEDKNAALKAQMMLFEEKTKRIQFLIAQTNLFDNMVLPKSPLQTKHKEDCLPKVIVCGATADNMPKLIMCDVNAKKRRVCKAIKQPEEINNYCGGGGGNELAASGCGGGGGGNPVPKIAKRLSDSYFMQEKLANENANLEGMRYKLQSDLLNKDQTIEYLQRKLCAIQCEMRMICKENAALNDKINKVISGQQGQQQGGAAMRGGDPTSSVSKRMICGKKRGDCPAEFEHRLNEYSETTKQLEKQLCDMENDVKGMHTELQAVQAEREHLEQHRNIVICPPICLPPPPCSHSPCPPQPPCGSPRPCDQPLRELREQYNRLQDDFKGKVTEVAGLRADNEKFKLVAREAEEAKKAMDEKVKECDKMMKAMKNEKSMFMGSKEQLIEQEQQLIVAKQRFREAQDELEELRLFIQEQQGQMDDYRSKYLDSEQKVEEQRRHIDMLEMDATRINEQVNLEIQRVKGQFQEKLHELMPLPDILKSTQIKLNEAQQMHLLAERNSEALEKELNVYKEKVAAISNQMDKVRSDQQLGEDEKVSLGTRVEELEERIKQLQDGNDLLNDELSKMEDLLDEKELELQAKMHEIAQLQAQLESVREESARQVARNKERCETVRRSMQNQISDLERQLVQSRAQAKAAQKDRDEIRVKMQQQISNLHENFEDAQMRIRNLQGHVNFLKVSYPSPVKQGGDSESVTSEDPCNCP